MTGHKLVRFSAEGARAAAAVRRTRRAALLGRLQSRRRRALRRVVRAGDAHDLSRPAARSTKLPPTHPLYRAFFQFPDGPPQTAHELNGWGDDLVHDYLRGVEHNGRLGVLYSNKDYGCEWDYDWRNKRFQRDDNTRFAVNIVVYAMTS